MKKIMKTFDSMKTFAIHPSTNIEPDGLHGYCTLEPDETRKLVLRLLHEHSHEGFPSPANPEVMLVHVPAEHFVATTRDALDGEVVHQRFQARDKIDEDPRMSAPFVTEGEHLPAGGLTLVVYPEHLLGKHRSSNADGEVVAMIPTDKRLPRMISEPMHYLTMLYNYTHSSGGTDADKLSAEQKFTNLCEAFLYWHKKVFVDLSKENE